MSEVDSSKATNAEPISASVRLRIGLSILDGASSQWICDTFAVSGSDVDESWTACRQALSKYFAKSEGTEFRLMSEAEIRERLDGSLRLLVEWRASALQSERAAALTASARTSGGQQRAPEVADASTNEGASDEAPRCE